MTSFAIIGHLARTDGGFSLNDLPGSGGRMDVLCRCVNTSLFLSHDLRRDVDCYLILCGEPAGPKTVKFSGELVRSLSPDERSAAALIKKVIDTPCGSEFREAAQGVFIRKGGLERLMTEHTFARAGRERDGYPEGRVPAGCLPALGPPEFHGRGRRP